ncbi:hypothetical protein D3C80_2146770 [compost metagenome]
MDKDVHRCFGAWPLRQDDIKNLPPAWAISYIGPQLRSGRKLPAAPHEFGSNCIEVGYEVTNPV